MIYSIIPAIAAMLFLIMSVFIWLRNGKQRHHIALILLCVTTFFWQGTWSVLFQISDPGIADILIKIGYSLIIFLPTTLYHFLSEVSMKYSERKYVYISYTISSVFFITLMTSNLFIDGRYDYFYGHYPKAGLLHPLHLLQTLIVTSRGLYIVYSTHQKSTGIFKEQLKYCMISLFVYTFAAIDYLGNYGIGIYPPGIFFILLSFITLTFAIYKKDLINSIEDILRNENAAKLNTIKSAAGNLAHELRTPLATIRLNAITAQNKCNQPQHQSIIDSTQRANMSIDLLLNNVRQDTMTNIDHKLHSITDHINDALKTYPFKNNFNKISFDKSNDFYFLGNSNLTTFIFYNLINNSLYYISAENKGHINIRIERHNNCNIVYFRDSSAGIHPEKIKHIFDDFYTTKINGDGTGLGLSFCKKAMISMGGSISVNSIHTKYTEFLLTFPQARTQEI